MLEVRGSRVRYDEANVARRVIVQGLLKRCANRCCGLFTSVRLSRRRRDRRQSWNHRKASLRNHG